VPFTDFVYHITNVRNCCVCCLVEWQQDEKRQSIVVATSAGGGCKPRRRRLHLGYDRRSMTSPEADVVAVVGRSQGQSQGRGQGRRRYSCTPHTQLSPEAKRRRAGSSTNREYYFILFYLFESDLMWVHNTINNPNTHTHRKITKTYTHDTIKSKITLILNRWHLVSQRHYGYNPSAASSNSSVFSLSLNPAAVGDVSRTSCSIWFHVTGPETAK